MPKRKKESSRRKGLKIRKKVTPKTPVQEEYVQSIINNDLTIGIGATGSGKTLLAVYQALRALQEKSIDKIIISRPAVESEEKIGYLPGEVEEKLHPYFLPVYDSMQMLGVNPDELRAEGTLEIAPLGFMRGRTLSRCFIILDEAQNTQPSQVYMFLTRIGEKSKVVLTGDPEQRDIPGADGLSKAAEFLEDVDGIGVVRFGKGDIRRSNLVRKVVRYWEN